jgi:Fur family zinc uptake transcriptional regulator
MPYKPTGFSLHDHDGCIAKGMQAAEVLCAAKGLQLTPVRRRTLEILLQAHEAMGAYDVLARLSEDGFGDKPPVAYRALAFLQDHGFVHRIERLNAFVACARPGADHDPAFMICRSCGKVAESELSGSGLTASARESGFVIEQTVIEAEGLCPGCQP